MNKKTLILFLATFWLFLPSVFAYEIPNHADMSERAALISQLSQDIGSQGKLVRLGLKDVRTTNNAQTFPLDLNLPPIGLCFGIKVGSDGAVIADDALGAQPSWGNATNGPNLTIAQLLRYGACYEDAEEPTPRSFAHFYNPQDNGAGLSYGLALGPNSPDWILKRSPGDSGRVGINHYTWEDARINFYYALTQRDLTPDRPVTGDVRREAAWGRTFQALGHITHHLQDMAQPQHVRNDAHCDDTTKCGGGVPGVFGAYRPSVYEKYLLDRFQFVRNLAALANTPMVFGLPKEFWSMDGDSFNGMIA